jgi:hypothetical protein
MPDHIVMPKTMTTMARFSHISRDSSPVGRRTKVRRDQ